MEALTTIADELYGLPREEFIRGRDQRAAQERRDGSESLASEIKSLRKPSAAAWVVNMLVRQQIELLEDVVALGKQMREQPAGDQFRALERQRRDLLRAAVEAGRTAATEGGTKLGPAAVTSLEETVHAAFADPDGARAVLSGRLVREISALGLEPVDLDGAVAVAGDLPDLPDLEPRVRETPAPTKAPKEGKDASRARAAVKAARQEAKTAQKDADTAHKRRDELEKRRDALQEEHDELSRQVEELESRITDLDTGLRRRERDVEQADKARTAADEALDDALAALDAVGSTDES